MRIYTRTGDNGETGILGGERVSKAEARLHALGSLDELNAVLGAVLSTAAVPPALVQTLVHIQNVLFEAGAAAASLDPNAKQALFPEETRWLEQSIDEAEARLPPLVNFILPGGGVAGAGLHWARTVARRAEREVIAALGHEPERAPLLAWINRLSDALFVWARQVNHEQGVQETPWNSSV